MNNVLEKHSFITIYNVYNSSIASLFTQIDNMTSPSPSDQLTASTSTIIRRNKTKRLADGTVKTYAYSCKQQIRKTIECSFSTLTDKGRFDAKLENVRQNIGKDVKITKVIEILMDSYILKRDARVKNFTTPESAVDPVSIQPDGSIESPEFALFEISQIDHLISNLSAHVKCCEETISVEYLVKRGHAVKMHYGCSAGHRIMCESSSKMGNTYIANYRLYLGYICSGMTQSQ